jgi:hypothetical protein
MTQRLTECDHTKEVRVALTYLLPNVAGLYRGQRNQASWDRNKLVLAHGVRLALLSSLV